MFCICGNNNSGFTFPFNNFFRPTKQIFPIVSTYLFKNIMPIFFCNAFQASHRTGILRFFEKTDYIVLIRREVHIFHCSTGGICLNNEIVTLPIFGFCCMYIFCHSSTPHGLINKNDRSVIVVAFCPEIQPIA